MLFQDELNQVSRTPEDIQSQSYTYGVNVANRAYQEIKTALLECAKEGKYENNNSKKQITYEYSDKWFFDHVLELKRRDVIINKSFFNRGGQHAYEAHFYIKNQMAFDAYMEKLEQLCKNDGIFIQLKVYYNSLEGQKIYNIDEKIVDFSLRLRDIKLYIICTVEY